MAFFRRKKKSISPIPLNQLLTQVRNILVEQQEDFLQQQIKRVDQLFAEDGTPYYKTIKTDQKKSLKVPLLSLVNPQVLELQEFDITFEAPLSSTDKKKIKEEQNKIKDEGLTLDYSDSKQHQGMVTLSFKYKKKTLNKTSLSV